jgi:hypothetical protein|tara:strand:+ start:381 stop:668 length:288 start_codon:yes stop_codon:yes gene_type:complete
MEEDINDFLIKARDKYRIKYYKNFITVWYYIISSGFAKCIDCVENEQVYGSDTEYMIGGYAETRSGFCTIHHDIHIDTMHYDEDYCDFCEMKVGK